MDYHISSSVASLELARVFCSDTRATTAAGRPGSRRACLRSPSSAAAPAELVERGLEVAHDLGGPVSQHGHLRPPQPPPDSRQALLRRALPGDLEHPRGDDGRRHSAPHPVERAAPPNRRADLAHRVVLAPRQKFQDDCFVASDDRPQVPGVVASELHVAAVGDHRALYRVQGVRGAVDVAPELPRRGEVRRAVVEGGAAGLRGSPRTGPTCRPPRPRSWSTRGSRAGDDDDEAGRGGASAGAARTVAAAAVSIARRERGEVERGAELFSSDARRRRGGCPAGTPPPAGRGPRRASVSARTRRAWRASAAATVARRRRRARSRASGVGDARRSGSPTPARAVVRRVAGSTGRSSVVPRRPR